MAEHVQDALDAMVAPLRDLLDRNVFSEVEVKAIVSRRRESEYLLRRKAARKADFLRYIEAEKQLELLRKLRDKQRKRDFDYAASIQNDGDNADGKNKERIGDVHIVQQIHLLFVRAIRKFRSDLSLHLLHAEFCKEQHSNKRLGRVYAEALQIFPRQTGLWIEAASNEFFGDTSSRSIQSARVLLQRGLRINKGAQDLWLEYFALELHFAQFLRGRREILKGEKEFNAGETYKIVSIIYKNAIRSVPDSVEFRLKFMDICKQFPFTDTILDTIHSTMQQDFQDKPEAWIARAMYTAEKAKKKQGQQSTSITKMDELAKDADGIDGEDNAGGDSDNDNSDDDSSSENRPAKRKKTEFTDPVLNVLNQAIAAISTDNMYLQAFRFAVSYRTQHDEDSEEYTAVTKFIEQTLLAQRASTSSAQSTSSSASSSKQKQQQSTATDFVLEQIAYHVSNNDMDKAETKLQRHCEASSTQSPVPAILWIQWSLLSPNNVKKKLRILRKGADSTDIHKQDHLMVLLQLFMTLLAQNKPKSNATIAQTFDKILLLSAGFPSAMELEGIPTVVQDASELFVPYLEYILEQDDDIRGVRKLYEKVLFHSTIHIHEKSLECIKDFVDRCIQLEKSRSKQQLRRVYDKAIDLFADTSLEQIYREQKNEDVVYA